MENPSNIVPDQLIVLEGDVGLVPKASPSDAGKVLGVLNASGDVGWVVDQSGTFIQQQSNWSETDSSKVTYIENKPDLSVYATTSAMNTALAGKQNTISDLDTIRAGAEAGSTAVQPADLATVATSGSYADLSNKPAIPSVDQTYNAASANAQSGVAVAQAIAAIPAPSVDEVPAVTSSDDGKVLKASYSGGQGSYAWGADGFTTTAGITDIQVVNALPASPVATVLYMIPEA